MRLRNLAHLPFLVLSILHSSKATIDRYGDFAEVSLSGLPQGEVQQLTGEVDNTIFPKGCGVHLRSTELCRIESLASDEPAFGQWKMLQSPYQISSFEGARAQAAKTANDDIRAGTKSAPSWNTFAVVFQLVEVAALLATMAAASLPWGKPRAARGLTLFCLMGALLQGADAGGIADVCWETELNTLDNPCDNAEGRFDPDPPDGIGYTPTCFKDDISTATIVPESELHAVRCISDSTQFGYAYCDARLNFQDALALCENFAGDSSKSWTVSISDWRLPATPQEAGRLCGSGCNYDFEAIWVGFGVTEAPTSSPTASPTASTA
eukprot:CAMPEP_0118944138 /NCGR_PEP_ID=MMETSP1169-20130426/39710_1 /TAXON_ID=36882 /ORGANISM="Pyramimonas obovata, Strain CCMP722" /LENGTH=322 /DNA_ID=CAMNT_0006889555 /DNA_START=7 /DNA_END=971 /DNA_ORIENTATION=+